MIIILLMRFIYFERTKKRRRSITPRSDAKVFTIDRHFITPPYRTCFFMRHAEYKNDCIITNAANYFMLKSAEILLVIVTARRHVSQLY